MNQSTEPQTWTQIITSRHRFFSFPVREVLAYKDLLFMFVRRDFVAFYKQTILGPIWFFVQPILTTIIFTIIFGRVAQISTDGVPDILFYLAGVTAWSYFAACWQGTMDIFKANQHIFGKVYFPRIIMPLSVVLTNLIRFGIQLTLFLLVYAYYMLIDAGIAPNATLLMFPALVILMALFSLALGLLVSALTVKYRDLVFLMQFAIQLAMYATPVVYPLSIVSPEKQWILLLNPMTAIVETFRYGFLGSGAFVPMHLVVSALIVLITLILGLLVFNRIEKSFMDVV